MGNDKYKKIALPLCSEWRFDPQTLIYGTISVTIGKTTLIKPTAKDRFVVINSGQQLLLYSGKCDGYVVDLNSVVKVREKLNTKMDKAMRVSTFKNSFIIKTDGFNGAGTVTLHLTEQEDLESWRDNLRKTIGPTKFLNYDMFESSFACNSLLVKSATTPMFSSIASQSLSYVPRKNSTISGFLKKRLTFKRKSQTSTGDISIYDYSMDFCASRDLNLSDEVFGNTGDLTLNKYESGYEKLHIADGRMSRDSGISTINSQENISEIKSMYDEVYDYGLMGAQVAFKLSKLKGNKLPPFTNEKLLVFLQKKVDYVNNF